MNAMPNDQYRMPNCGAAKPRHFHPSSFILLTFLICLPVYARLGETPKQIEARYGPPKGRMNMISTNDGYRYSHGGYSIAVHYGPNRLADCEWYDLSREGVTDETIRALLEIHGDGKTWDEVPIEMIEARLWKRADGEVSAVRTLMPPCLAVGTPAYWKAFGQKQDADVRDTLKGF